MTHSGNAPQTQMTLRAFWVAVAVVLCASGCGGDDTPGASDAVTTGQPTIASTAGSTTTARSSGGDTDANCPVTVSEVGAAIGTTTKAEGAQAVPGGSTCDFSYENGRLAVRVYRSAAKSGYEASLKVIADSETITGVGDKATWSATIGVLFVLKGDTGLQIQILKLGAPKPGGPGREAAMTVARAAIGRL